MKIISENNPYYKSLEAKVRCEKNVFIAHNAVVIGDIQLDEHVSIWYNAVLRADFDKIHIGESTNIQEGVLIHVDPGKPVTIGKENIVGHGAMIHGCTIGDHNLIGIKSTVLNGAKIGNGCIIGAHTLITENMEIPDYSMVLGSPGKIVKTLPPEVIEKIKLGAAVYRNEALKYIEQFK
ncbi:MAG: gamma carbonic anhydrase family protein [Chitinophagaceae bacterium]|nr:MAG: gamma carbonic anhydrase family protein [Chitinophagaceae bacterium]